jgi:UDP-glucose 4-epimerase
VSKKILVTGGAGFIGANLCRVLIARGHEVSVLDDLSTGYRSNLTTVAPEASFIEGSILDQEVVRSCLHQVDSVVHLAARPSVPRSIADPVASHNVNVNGTINVLEACRAQSQPPQVIFASSSSVYGANPALPKHEDLATLPRSPYAASKLAGESYVLSYGSSFNLDVLPFRFFNVYGPLQMAGHAYAAVVPAFVAAALTGVPLPVHGDGLQTRDFTFVDTVANVIATAVEQRKTADRGINLAFGTRSSLLDVTKLLEEILDLQLQREHGGTRAGDVRDSQADNARLRQLFPSVSPVDLRTGLEATVTWMKSHID